jgi:hypothetical protein
MNRKKHEKIFFNRAEVTEAERIHCDNCFEQVVFMLRDKEHEFSLGLSTVLECLAFAVVNGDLPKLPGSWCRNAEDSVGKNIFANETQYHDYCPKRMREQNEDFQDNCDAHCAEV